MTGLDPSGDEGRELLRRELLRPEYNEQNPVLRFLDWLGRQLDGGLERASRVDPLVTAAGMVALLLVALGLIWLVARARTERRTRTETGGVLDDVVETAAELRARAEAALAAGDTETALLEGFRALALRQVEAGRLADLPGATAREIADTLATAHPAREARARRAASAFDGVLYGGRRVGVDVVTEVLALDDDLAGVR